MNDEAIGGRTGRTGNKSPASVPHRCYRDSLSALALLGMRAAGADGYAYFEKHTGTGTLRCLAACGTPIPETGPIAGCHGPGVVEYLLNSNRAAEGVLAFAFSEPPPTPERLRLDQIADAIARIWAKSHQCLDRSSRWEPLRQARRREDRRPRPGAI